MGGTLTAAGAAIPRLQELAAAEREEEQDGDSEVDAEARQEGRDLAQRKPGLGDDPVGDAAVDADRREAAGLRAMDDHQTHQQRRDAVLEREPERDRGDDGHGARADRADRRQARRRSRT